MLYTILIVVLICMLIGGLPTFGYAPAGAGYWPSGIIGILLVVFLILVLTHRI